MPLTRRIRTHRALACAALLASTACRSYVPLAGPPPPAAREVRFVLTDAGSDSPATYVGPRARTIDGVLLASSDSALVISVRDVTRVDGGDEPWKGERVTIPRSALATTSVSRLSAGRTGIFAAGAAVVGLALGQIFGGGSGAGGRTGGGGGSSGT
jgi:hypothetical protein